MEYYVVYKNTPFQGIEMTEVFTKKQKAIDWIDSNMPDYYDEHDDYFEFDEYKLCYFIYEYRSKNIINV